MLFIILLVLAAIVLTAILIALIDPKSEVGKWCAGIFKDAWSLLYTELGTVLKLLKHSETSTATPPVVTWEYSSLRIMGVALIVVPTLIVGGMAATIYQAVVQVGAGIVGAFMVWWSVHFDV